MGTERIISSHSRSVSMTYSRRMGRKAIDATDSAKTSNDDVVKEEASTPSADIISIKEDPSRLEKMTVQELRKTVRSVGITAKGTKRDLLSALKCFLDKDNGNPIVPGQAGSIETQVEPKRNANSKRKAEVSSGSNCYSKTNVELVSVHQRKKSKGKGLPVSEVDSSNICVEQEISICDERVSDGKAPNLNEPWAVLAHKKPQAGWVAYNPKIMRPPPLQDATKKMKIMSWNVNGLRALLKLESFSALELAQKEDFDVLCLQETKLQEKDVEKVKQKLIEGYDNSFWTCSVSKLGYSGTAIISRIKPLSVTYGLGIADHDSEGRLVTVEFDTFYVISGYVPNSGDGLKRLSYRIEEWDPSLSKYVKELEKSKPVILTGDLNCAHQEIDIYNPAGNRRSAGFTDEERESFGANFLSKGFVDTFRKQHPNAVGYTYWGFRHGGRATNRGWRLDYFLVSESIADKVHDSYILPEIKGSDHCPIGLILKV